MSLDPHGGDMHQQDQAFQDWLRVQQQVERLTKLFLVGCPKSGTSWVQRLLDGHPEIVVNGEGRWAWALLPPLMQAFDAFNQDQANHQGQGNIQSGDRALYFRGIVNTGLARYLQAAGADPSRVRVVGDKTPQHGVQMSPLSQTFPSARFIHIIRDPRDAATSAWFHFGVNDAQRDFETYIRYFLTEVWPLNVGRTRQVGAQLGDRYLELRYEDLSADEPAQIQRLLTHLGVRSDASTVQTCASAGAFRSNSGGRERGDADANSHWRKGVVGDWVNHLPKALVSECCHRISDLMHQCGYEPDVASAA